MIYSYGRYQSRACSDLVYWLPDQIIQASINLPPHQRYSQTGKTTSISDHIKSRRSISQFSKLGMKFACSRSFDTSKKFWVHWILVLLGTTCSSFCIHLKILLHGSHTMTLIDHLFQSQIEKTTSIYRNISSLIDQFLSDPGPIIVIPDICHFFYTGKIFGE